MEENGMLTPSELGGSSAAASQLSEEVHPLRDHWAIMKLYVWPGYIGNYRLHEPRGLSASEAPISAEAVDNKGI